jgi:asparagine synthase (glutamine-hydrolysing)
MCGIVGVINLTGEPERPESIAAMTARLIHRGPDGSRSYSHGPVALGHARLRIIDLSEQADQPLFNSDRSLAIVFNGEIYNFPQLRAELEAEGYLFRTRSDTEVILALYERQGTSCFARLDGMFALAIWDTRARQLVLARDRAGKKPLFLYRDGKRVAWASEVKALAAHPEITLEPDEYVLPFYLAYGYVPAPRSFHRRVSKLLPGRFAVVSLDGRAREEAFWSPVWDASHDLTPVEAQQSLRQLLSEAVRKRLVGDVPVGAFLSGGVDSTVVVGLMSRLSRGPIQTFSVGFEEEPTYDETDYARLAARAFGTHHREIRIPPPSPELVEKLVHFHDGPFGDSSAIPTYLVSRLAREQVKVVLNGDGGDEIFAGYLRFWAAATSERIPAWLARAGSACAELLPYPPSPRHPVRRLRRWAEAARLPLPERYLRWVGYLPAELPAIFQRPAEVADREAVLDHLAAPLDLGGASALKRVLHLNFRTYLPEDLLVKMDRCSMAHGLEARSPLLDTALTEFAARLPDRFQLRGFKTKVLLRKAFRDLIPGPILRRPKMGFGIPLGPWLRGPLRGYLLDQVGGSRSRIFDFLKPERVEPYLKAHLAGERDFGHQLFALLTLEIWMRSW